MSVSPLGWLLMVVSDGVEDSNPDSVVVIVAGNNAPLADAGDNATVDEFMLVSLDGSGSNDPDGDSLSYAWEQVVDHRWNCSTT